MVDSVNNNNNALTYAGLGVGVGALGGAAYGGHFSKPLLKGDAPSDAFVRRYYDVDAKEQIASAGEKAKKALTESDAYKTAGDNIDALKDIVKNDAGKFGVKAEAGKTIDDAVEAFVGGETDAAKLKTKMEKAYADVASETTAKSFKDAKKMQAAKEAFAKLADDVNDDALKAFVKEHAEILNVAEDGIDDAVKGGKTGVKNLVDTAAKPLADKADELKGFIKDGKFNFEGVSDAIKKAAKDTKLWAGAKWAMIGAAVVGLGTYIGAKLAAPNNNDQV